MMEIDAGAFASSRKRPSRIFVMIVPRGVVGQGPSKKGAAIIYGRESRAQ